jgi:adenylate kinase family enzyme
MDRGDLVPDQLVIDMVMERLARPDAARDIAQAVLAAAGGPTA